MATSLSINIESETEEGLFNILHHIVKEVTAGPVDIEDIDWGAGIEDGMLKIDNGLIKGKYSWSLD